MIIINWTQEMIDAGIKLWFDGKSAIQVAWELSYRFDCTVTKNAWLGKFNRLVAKGLVLRREDYKPVVRDLKSFPKNSTGKKLRLPKVKLADSVPKENVVKFKPLVRPVSKTGLVTIDRATGCLYAVTATSKGIHLFCNKTKSGQSQYCQEHHDLCHTKSTLPVKKILYFIR